MQDIIHASLRRAAHDPSPSPRRSRMSVQHRSAILATAVLSLACASRGAVPEAGGGSPAPAITTGAQLIDAMHARYAGRYLTTLSFLQNNTLYLASGGEQKTQWLEHLAVPGRLRIDYLPLSTRSGVMYEGGRVHAFDNGRKIQSQPGVNALLLLGFDVYAQPAAVTARTLDSLGFDLRRMHTAQWQGRPVHVVGAVVGDSTANQFWVDAERLLFVRMFQHNPTGTVVTEYRFDRYTDFDGVPVAIEVLMLRNGRPFFKEEYANVRVNVPLPDALFDPERWTEAQPKLPAPPSPDADEHASRPMQSIPR